MSFRSELMKVVVRLESRADGGLRAWSDDVPGLVLSGHDAEKVYADIGPALETILSHTLKCHVEAHPLKSFSAAIGAPATRKGERPARFMANPQGELEYAAACG
jgi:hypothetical protein